MYLSYSGFKTYTGCPQAYWHRYINSTRLPVPENRVTMLFGSAVGRLFEMFYNDRIWTVKGSEAALLLKVDTVINQIILQETREDLDGHTQGKIVWDDPKLNARTRYKSREHLAEDVRAAIPRGLAIIRHHRFIGLEAKAEVKLDSTFDGHTLGGRVDILIDRVKPDNDRVILDGKGSTWRETYVDARQLLWYGLLHRQKFGRLPDRLGFVFWRFEPDRAVDWVPFQHEALDSLQASALATIQRIQEGQKKLPGDGKLDISDESFRQTLWEAFAPSPSSQCKLCSYLFACQDGRNIVSGRFSVPEDSTTGVEEDIGFGV